MELDVTSAVLDSATLGNVYGSQMTHGPNAGAITWQAAKDAAVEAELLRTEAAFDAFRGHVQGFGAWDEEEINGWSDTECNALMLQMVAAEVSECPTDDDGEIDWAALEADEDGHYSHRLCRGDDGRVYYYLGD